MIEFQRRDLSKIKIIRKKLMNNASSNFEMKDIISVQYDKSIFNQTTNIRNRVAKKEKNLSNRVLPKIINFQYNLMFSKN